MTIVVAVDFSEASRRALDYAIEQAGKVGEPLVLVHGFAGPKRSKRGVSARLDPLAQVEAELDMDAAIELTQEWAAQARAAGLDVETVAEPGPPAELILGTARDRDASRIVMGTFGRSGLQRALLGSVAGDVVHGADRPVVMVPPPT